MRSCVIWDRFRGIDLYESALCAWCSDGPLSGESSGRKLAEIAHVHDGDEWEFWPSPLQQVGDAAIPSTFKDCVTIYRCGGIRESKLQLVYSKYP